MLKSKVPLKPISEEEMHDVTTSTTPRVIPPVEPQSKNILALRKYKTTLLDKDKQVQRDHGPIPNLHEVNYPLEQSEHKKKAKDQVLDIPSINDQSAKYGISKTHSEVLSVRNQSENMKALRNQSQNHLSDVAHTANMHHRLSKYTQVLDNIEQLGKQPVVKSVCAPIKESITISKKRSLVVTSSPEEIASDVSESIPFTVVRNEQFSTSNDSLSSPTSSNGSGVREIVPDGKVTRKRSHTLCQKLWNKKDDNKITVMMNKNGKPIGKEENDLASFLGTIARNSKMAPLNYKDWRLLPSEKKETMLQFVESKFNIDKKMRKWVIWSISKKWRDFKCELKREFYKPHLTMEQRLKNRDCRVAMEQWKLLNEYWDTEEANARCAKNKSSRKKLKMSHTSGTQSFSCLQHNLEQKKGGPINQLEFFIQAHKTKDGKPVDEAAKEIISQFGEALEQLDDSMDAATIDDIYYKVTGKKPTYDRQSDRVNSEESDSEQIGKKELELKLEEQQKEMESQRQEINLLKEKQKNLELMIFKRSREMKRELELKIEEQQEEMESQRQEINLSKEKQKNLELMIFKRSREMRRELQNFKKSDCASLEPYPGSSVSGGRKFSQSLTSEGKDVFIMSFDNSKLKVAMGQVCSVDPLTSIGGTQLGSKFVGVRVEVALEEEEPLLRPFNQYQTIGDARGMIIAWPEKLLVEQD